MVVAGLLQRMEVPAGVAMVSRNLKGKRTNNGHGVALVRLPDGTDTIVDCSDPVPFVRQQGLFVRERDYTYVAPVYWGNSGIITRYRCAVDGRIVSPAQVRRMDTGFLHSRFYFYRGERTPGGILAHKPSSEGLEQAAEYLRESVRLCPGNPLAVSTLGRVDLKQGKQAQARTTFRRAYQTYARAGWVPRAPCELYARTHGAAPPVAVSLGR